MRRVAEEIEIWEVGEWMVGKRCRYIDEERVQGCHAGREKERENEKSARVEADATSDHRSLGI